jgi:hypothetical protein
VYHELGGIAGHLELSYGVNLQRKNNGRLLSHTAHRKEHLSSPRQQKHRQISSYRSGWKSTPAISQRVPIQGPRGWFFRATLLTPLLNVASSYILGKDPCYSRDSPIFHITNLQLYQIEAFQTYYNSILQLFLVFYIPKIENVSLKHFQMAYIAQFTALKSCSS